MVDSNSSIEKTRAKDEERNVFLVFLAKPSMENLARETISFDIYLVDTINKVSGRKKKIQANRRSRIISEEYPSNGMESWTHPLRLHPSYRYPFPFHPLRRPDNPADRGKPVA